MNNKVSNTISLILHCILFYWLISSKSTNVLIPSSSDGVEVSIVSMDHVTHTTVIPRPVIQAQQIAEPTENNNVAKPDIVIKKQELKKVKKIPETPNLNKIIPPKVVSKEKPQVKANKTNKAINDLLSDISPNGTSGHGKVHSNKDNGGSSSNNNMTHNYADAVVNLIRPYVEIPNNIDPNAVATVQVTLLPNMHVYNVRLVQSSGNIEYDNNVKQAILKAAMFPPLPNGSSWADFRKINLTFKPE